METNKHYPILTVDQAGSLVDVDETGGVAVSKSVGEPVERFAQGVPSSIHDPQRFKKWLKAEHARLNGRQHG